ncbi:MAG: TetR/AcrR family transcriptional regulator [Microthrixaceae bacterium]
MTALPEAADTAEAKTPIRDRILEGAAQRFRRYGVAKTTLEDIAAEAGTSRATIYRTIPGGRDEIILTVLLSEGQATLEPVFETMYATDGFESQLVEGMALVVEASRNDPQLAMLFTAETLMTSVVLPGAWDAVVSATAESLAPLTSAARAADELREGLDDEEISDWIVRVIVSILAFPGDFASTPRELRNYLATYAVPSLLTGTA